MNNLKDKEFKIIMKDKFKAKSLNNNNCDYEMDVEGTHVLFEYENSSRGLVHNLIKIMMKEGDSLENKLLIMIRTNHHVKWHDLDKRRAEWLVGKNSNPNLIIKIIPESIFWDKLKTINAKDLRSFEFDL